MKPLHSTAPDPLQPRATRSAGRRPPTPISSIVAALLLISFLPEAAPLVAARRTEPNQVANTSQTPASSSPSIAYLGIHHHHLHLHHDQQQQPDDAHERAIKLLPNGHHDDRNSSRRADKQINLPAVWQSALHRTRQVIMQITHKLLLKSATKKTNHVQRVAIERRVNPLLLPLRLVVGLLRLLLLPVRLLLAPVILILRALLRLLRLLVLLLNPLFYFYLALAALNLAANIGRIVMLILRFVLLRRFKRKHQEDETRVITMLDEAPVEPSKWKYAKSKKLLANRPSRRHNNTHTARIDSDSALEARLIRNAEREITDRLQWLRLLVHLAPLNSADQRLHPCNLPPAAHLTPTYLIRPELNLTGAPFYATWPAAAI